MKDAKPSLTEISCEIRNPISLISSSLHMIEDMHPEVRDFLFWPQTLENVEYVTLLLDDLSEYAGQSRFFMCDVDIRQVLSSIGEGVRPYASNHKKNFCMHLPTCLPHVFGNPVKLKQAFLNIIKNAFESTDEGGCVNLSARKYLDQIIVRISNDGCAGRAAADNVFSPSVSDVSDSLGLAVTRKIIAAHYGDIKMDSMPGRGKSVTVTLPHL